MNGLIFDVKRFAIHDGPGIRTTLFLKGCPLRCVWCHNPESQPFGVRSYGEGERKTVVGREIAVEEAVRELARDRVFFDESGGGVTISGGEPLSQPEFLLALLEGCGAQGLHRTVDTSGYAPREVLRAAAARAELVLFDLKQPDADAHRDQTGVDFALIRDNLRALCDTDVAIELRLPMIPGLNDSEAMLAGMRALIESLPRRLPVRLLPYHRAAMGKYPRFGMRPPLPDTAEPTAEQMAFYRMKLGL